MKLSEEIKRQHWLEIDCYFNSLFICLLFEACCLMKLAWVYLTIAISRTRKLGGMMAAIKV